MAAGPCDSSPWGILLPGAIAFSCTMVSCSFLRNNEKYFLAEGINKRKTYLKVCMRRSILEAAKIFFLMTALRSASIPWCSGAAGAWGSALSSSSPHTFRITTKLSTTTERTGLRSSYISRSNLLQIPFSATKGIDQANTFMKFGNQYGWGIWLNWRIFITWEIDAKKGW